MNEGWLLLLTVITCAGTAITVLWYRDLIWPERFPRMEQPRPRPRPRLASSGPRRPAGETKPKRAATVSPAVSGFATPQTDAEMIAVWAIAKLVAANMVTETAALETVFDVKAGSKKDYKRVQAKLKQAQSELESTPAP